MDIMEMEKTAVPLAMPEGFVFFPYDPIQARLEGDEVCPYCVGYYEKQIGVLNVTVTHDDGDVRVKASGLIILYDTELKKTRDFSYEVSKYGSILVYNHEVDPVFSSRYWENVIQWAISK